MIVTLIKNFQPQITAIEHGPEATIYEMMLHYYVSHGLPVDKAQTCVENYLDKLESISLQQL